MVKCIVGIRIAALLFAASSSVCMAAAPDDLMKIGVQAFQQGDHAEAHRVFRILAQGNAPVAETLLGTMAANGQGMEQDNAVAAAWFLRAARRGYGPAQLALANAFARGHGVPRDLARAKKLADAAATQGQPGAIRLAQRLEPQLYAMLSTR